MLGMTATPERTDGINIFELFGHNIAYEIRLQKALDENMLCPFHYYGVAEYLGSDEDADQDMHRLDVSQGLDAKESKQLKYEIGQLATEQRVRYIIDKLQEYGQFGDPRHRAGVLQQAGGGARAVPLVQRALEPASGTPLSHGSGDQQRRPTAAVIAGKNATNTSGGSPTANSTTCSPSTCSTRASISPPSTRS